MLVAVGATAAILLLRLPSFFEPPWNTDEGIFAAVAQRVAHGGSLYLDAWESKPPLFLYLYAGLFKVFGAGVFPLRLAATASAIGTQWSVYGLGRRYFEPRRALAASLIAGVLMGVPFWEGTLALTEIFTVLPTCLAVLIVMRWDVRPRSGWRSDLWLLLAGGLFGVAFLIRQTSILAGGAVGLWLMLRGRAWVRAGAWLMVGLVAAVAPMLLAFALLGTFHWFWDANVTFFFKYIPSGQQLPFAYRPVILLPVAVGIGCLVWYRNKRGEAPDWSLPLLWFVLLLGGAMLTGRPYSHYMLQTFPPLALLAMFILPTVRLAWRPTRAVAPLLILAATIALEWGYVVVPMFSNNLFAMHFTHGPTYYENFFGYAVGLRSQARYDDYFDLRVKQTYMLEKTLRKLGAEGHKVYIWGEYPWVYPLADVQPSDRYMTSFYVLLLPYLDMRFESTLATEKPRYIVLMTDAKPKVANSSPVVGRRYRNATRALDELLASQYRRVAIVGNAHVFARLSTPLAGGEAAVSTGYPTSEP